jgi:Protein of unknown function (DUF2887)
VELKKALRIDGLYKPNKRTLPLYFIEVQFQRAPRRLRTKAEDPLQDAVEGQKVIDMVEELRFGVSGS